MEILNSGVNGEELPEGWHGKTFLLQKEKRLWIETGMLREERMVVRGGRCKGAAVATEQTAWATQKEGGADLN